jgi:anhydro-N-acetylmuramic acid kinase
MSEYYIGLMSGTSLDGVDAVLARFDQPDHPIQVHGHVYRPFGTVLRQEMMTLNRTGSDELHRSSLAANSLSQVYANVVKQLLDHCGLSRERVRALGAHGQTVRHRPGEFDGTGYTIQLLNAALLAELSGIDVVYDFRNRDVAAGGQGAPLVPAFHAAAFDRPQTDQAVLNLGGIANITLLAAAGQVMGFDCGPGNVLMDLWCERHIGAAYDNNGHWAATGNVLPDLLGCLLADPYVRRAPPKSTGRDLYHADWLDKKIAAVPSNNLSAACDVQATLAEFTCIAAKQAVLTQLPTTTRLVVCGGGALNGHLMRRLTCLLPAVQVIGSDAAGLPPLQVEATAFAWLAKACIEQTPANCPAVTGAKGPRILGSLHRAN